MESQTRQPRQKRTTVNLNYRNLEDYVDSDEEFQISQDLNFLQMVLQ